METGVRKEYFCVRDLAACADFHLRRYSTSRSPQLIQRIFASALLAAMPPAIAPAIIPVTPLTRMDPAPAAVLLSMAILTMEPITNPVKAPIILILKNGSGGGGGTFPCRMYHIINEMGTVPHQPPRKAATAFTV